MNRLVRVLEDVYSIDHSDVGDHGLETWVLDSREGVALVDSGMRVTAVDNIGRELKHIGRGWNDVKLILVTHKHRDHVSNLPRLVELTGAPVMAEEHEAPLIEAAVGVKVVGLRHGEVLDFCGGVEVVHVPGHSEGNACYYLRKQRAMIAGDTVFGDTEGNLKAPPEQYCMYAAMAAREIRRLLAYDFDHLLITHGKDIMGEGKKCVQMLVERC